MSEDSLRDDASEATPTDDADWPRDAEARLKRIGQATMNVTVEVGRVRMPLEKVLQAEPGTVLGTTRLAGQPFDILVNGALYGKGEAVVIGDNLAIRVTDLVGPGK